MKIAVMQPYIFPYLGYFQLINATDKFIFYDDVNYIKGGWINRNRILVNSKPYLFTIPLDDASSFSTIKDTLIHQKFFPIWKNKFLKSVNQNYKNSPFFEDIMPIIENVLSASDLTISELAINSITNVSKYLGLDVVFEKSSENYSETIGLERTERLLKLCSLNNSTTYLNPLGGIELYNKKHFKERGVDLYFIKNELKKYKQFNNDFIPGLSIIDVLMFNDKAEVKQMLNDYTLI